MSTIPTMKEAQAKLPELVANLGSGEELIITHGGVRKRGIMFPILLQERELRSRNAVTRLTGGVYPVPKTAIPGLDGVECCIRRGGTRDDA